jgi:hypothetical protein
MQNESKAILACLNGAAALANDLVPQQKGQLKRSQATTPA